MVSDDIVGFICASGNKGFRPINRPCFLKIKNFEGVRQREKKISQFFHVADVLKGFFFKGRSGEKNQKGIPN